MNFFGVGLYCCDVLQSRRNSLKCRNQGKNKVKLKKDQHFDTGSESNLIMFCSLLNLSAWRINKAKFAWKQAIRLEISPSIKDKKGKTPVRHLEKVSNIAQSGLERIMCPLRFRKVPFSSFHTYTRKQRFQKVPLWRAFWKSFPERFYRIRVDGSRIRSEKVAFSNENRYVQTGPQSY